MDQVVTVHGPRAITRLCRLTAYCTDRPPLGVIVNAGRTLESLTHRRESASAV